MSHTIKYLDHSFPTPAGNLAADEALLDHCEECGEGETLRFWEAREPFVVVGYANKAAREVDLDACQADGIPVLRRCSGGGTVLQGPGCLNYSLILRIPETGSLRGIAETNRYILERHQSALEPLLPTRALLEGHTDLAIRNLKFSGNAQRRRRRALLFHGTFLLHFELALISKYLRPPSQQPDYRQSRPHADFLTNLNLPAAVVKTALQKCWQAAEPAPDLPLVNVPELVLKYSSDGWNFKT